MPQPRRRASDGDRRRWNDQAIDLLAGRVDDSENQIEALRMLPERVSGLKGAVENMQSDLQAAAGLEERRVAKLHEKIEKLSEKIDTRFDVVDEAHAAVATKGVDWKTVIAVAATVVVPIVVALIALAGASH